MFGQIQDYIYVINKCFMKKIPLDIYRKTLIFDPSSQMLKNGESS